MNNHRKLWRPRLPPREGGACAGCPFGTDNNKQFGTILTKLRQKNHDPRPVTDEEIQWARDEVKRERDMMGGDFACHASVYGAGTEERDVEHHRQCPGASEYYVKQGEILYQQKEKHAERTRRKRSA